MPHEVEKMFYQGADPWHGLGTRIPDGKDLTAQEALIAAGWDWETQLVPLYYRLPNGEERKADVCQVVRVGKEGDPKNYSSLGTVNKTFKPYQPQEAIAMLEPYIDSKEIIPHTGGVLSDGAVTWMCFRFGTQYEHEAEAVPGDPIERYFMFAQGHVANMAVTMGYTDIRIVCMNTLLAAMQSRKADTMKVRHSENVAARVAEVAKAIHEASAGFRQHIDILKSLASRQMTVAETNRYFRLLFKADLDTPENELPTRQRNRLGRMCQYFEEAPGNEYGFATAYAAFNAWTWWNSHERLESTTLARKENRLRGLYLDGVMNKDNQRALKLIRKFVSDGKLDPDYSKEEAETAA